MNALIETNTLTDMDCDESEAAANKLINKRNKHTLSHFLKGNFKKPPYRLDEEGEVLLGAGKHLAVVLEDGIYIVHDCEHDKWGGVWYIGSVAVGQLVGVLPLSIKRGLKKKSKVLILNGDEDGDGNVASMDINECVLNQPTISFICLARFFMEMEEDLTPSAQRAADSEATELAKRLISSGRMRLMDFSDDEYKKIPQKQIDAYDNNIDKKKMDHDQAVALMTPPERGFSKVGSSWHRPSSVLLKDTKTGLSYLFGQDDDTYFGCEMKTNASTLSEAFKALAPKAARNKKGVLRQGEWFAVPVDEKDVPKITDAIAVFEAEFDGRICLPVDHKDSAKHILEARKGLIDKDGVIHVNGFDLEHSEGDHPSMRDRSDKWYAFYCNTALRSFSQDGVD